MTPPTPEPTSFAEQTAAGEKLYQDHCASCHGGKGEGGGKSPKLVGAGALSTDPPKEAKQRKSKFNNANDVFEFVSKNMPPGQGGSLKDHEYWSIIAWDLKANGATSAKKLDSSTGASVSLKKK
jgi:S-disulfanyl-L-cysteine oxidoreductase SoxD